MFVVWTVIVAVAFPADPIRAWADTVVFDSDGNAANGVTEGGGVWAPGTTVTFLNGSTEVFTANDLTTDTAQFGNGGPLASLMPTVYLNAGSGGTNSIKGLRFGAVSTGGYVLTANTAQLLNLGSGGIDVASGALATSVGSANLRLALGASQSWTNNSASLLTIGGAVDLGGNVLTLSNSSTGGQTLTGIVSGAGSIVVNSTGSGVTTLAGLNTYLGTTTITSGTLSVGSLTAGASNLGNATSAIVLGSATTIGTLSYTGSGATFTRGFVVLAGGGALVNTSANLLTLDTTGVSIATGATFTLAANGTGGITFAFATDISGDGNVTIAGTGTGVVTLGVANSYTGATKVIGSILAVGSLSNAGVVGGLGQASADAANLLLDGGTLRYNANVASQATNRLFTLGLGGGTFDSSSTLAANTMSILNSGAIAFTGNGARTLTLTGSNTGSNVFAAILGDSTGGAASLTKSGTGNWTLLSAQTYTGTTNFSGGTLTLSGNGRLTASSSLAFRGGTLTILNATTEASLNRVNDLAPITSTGGGITISNTLSASTMYSESFGALSLSSGRFVVQSTVDNVGSLQSLVFESLTQGGTGTIFFSAVGGPNDTTNRIAVTNAGGSPIVQTPAGRILGPWATTGTPSGGQTDYAVYDAALNIVGSNATIAPSAETSWTDATMTYQMNVLQVLGGTRTITALRRTAGATLTLASGKDLLTYGILNGAGSTFTINQTSGAGSITTPSGGGNLYLNAGPNLGLLTINAPITDNGGVVSLVLGGDSTVTLGATNSFSGDIFVNAGTLAISALTQLGAATTTVTLNGGTLTLTSGTVDLGIDHKFVLEGAGGAIGSSGTLTVSGVVSGSGSLTKTGSSTLILSGNNTYTGNTILKAGTFSVSAAANLGGSSSSLVFDGGTLTVPSVGVVVDLGTRGLIFNSGGGTFNNSGASTILINGIVSGTGPLIKNGSATVILNSAENTFTGAVTITAGVLQAKTVNALGITFNGTSGTFRALADLSLPVVALNGTGSGTIDTGGFNVDVPVSITASGTQGLTKSGAGVLTINMPGIYTGQTFLTGGTLRTAVTNAFGNPTAGISITTSTILELFTSATSGTTTFGFTSASAYNIVIAGGATNTAPIIRVNSTTGSQVSGDIKLGNLTLNGSIAFSVAGTTGVGLILGAITSTGQDNNHYTINNIASPGTLTVGSYTQNLNTGGNFSFNGIGTTIVTGPIQQTGGGTVGVLINPSAGSAGGPTSTVVLSGDNTYTRDTVVNGGGTLILTRPASIPTGTGTGVVTVAANGALGLRYGSSGIETNFTATDFETLLLGGTFAASNALSKVSMTTPAFVGFDANVDLWPDYTLTTAGTVSTIGFAKLGIGTLKLLGATNGPVGAFGGTLNITGSATSTPTTLVLTNSLSTIGGTLNASGTFNVSSLNARGGTFNALGTLTSTATVTVTAGGCNSPSARWKA